MARSTSSRRRARRAHRAAEYVLDAKNVHALASSLEAYPRDRHYAVCFDASIWARFDGLLASEPIGSLSAKRMLSLQVFYGELLRILEAYPNIIVIPEVKVELANLIAASRAQIDRQKLQYQGLSPTQKDRASKVLSSLLRLDELMRKLRTRLEERARAQPETDEVALKLLTETVVAIAETLHLKKPDATSSDVDERLIARAFHEVLCNHRRSAIFTRDEDVRRVTSSVYKLMVSQTVREEEIALVVKALKLGNLVVLKYNAEREEYCRFFESQTQTEIGEYIFSKFLSERAKVKLLNLVRTNMKQLARMLRDHEEAPAAYPQARVEAPPKLLGSLGLIYERMVWYQEVARAVGVADVHEEIRVTQALLEVARGLGHAELGDSVERALSRLMRQRVSTYLRELEAKEDALRRELDELASDARYQRDVRSAERLGAIGSEIADTAREKHFFARALGTGDFHLTHDDFRRTEEVVERLLANGYDVREQRCLIPAADLADLTGRDYRSILRLASEQELVEDGGLVAVDLATVISHLI